MDTLASHLDYGALLNIINARYAIGARDVVLHRDMIGYVYLVQTSARPYVLKLYRPFNSDQAIQTVELVAYLKRSAYPVVSIVCAEDGAGCIDVSLASSPCKAILYDYVEGVEPAIEEEVERIGRQVGWLHRLMDGYDGTVIRRGKSFYVDRYIDLLKRLSFDSSKIAELDQYGDELWDALSRLPPGFCHGDLHTGNMLRTGGNEYVLFDFDVAACAHNIIDVATLSDASNFNVFSDDAYDSTRRRLERFYQGYRRERSLTDAELAGVFDFIPVRHLEIIATIVECQGGGLSNDLMDEQHGWLMNWRRLCLKKRL